MKGIIDISLRKEKLTSEGEAQAEVVEAVRRAVVVTVRNAAEPRAAAPATATVHAARPTCRTGRIVLGGAAVITATIPITTPFPYIAAHIVDA